METAIEVLAVIGSLAGVAGVLGPFAYWWYGRRQVTWRDALKTAEGVISQIESGDWKPQAVLGLGRSGGIWGGWLAGNLGSLPFAVVDETYKVHPSGRDVYLHRPCEVLEGLRTNPALEDSYGPLRVLVVEGATSNGRTVQRFREGIDSVASQYDIKLAYLFKNRAVAESIDFLGRTLEPWPDKLPWHARSAYRTHMSWVARS